LEFHRRPLTDSNTARHAHMAAWPHFLIQGPGLGPRDQSMYNWRSRVRHHISSLSVICRTPYTPWIFTAGHQPTRILRGTPRPRICRKSAICRFPFPSLCSFFVLLRCCHVLSLQGSPALESLIYSYIHLGSARDNMCLVFIVTLTASGTTALGVPPSPTRGKAVEPRQAAIYFAAGVGWAP
jgi:hypothetical protein